MSRKIANWDGKKKRENKRPTIYFHFSIMMWQLFVSFCNMMIVYSDCDTRLRDNRVELER